MINMSRIEVVDWSRRSFRADNEFYSEDAYISESPENMRVCWRLAAFVGGSTLIGSKIALDARMAVWPMLSYFIHALLILGVVMAIGSILIMAFPDGVRRTHVSQSVPIGTGSKNPMMDLTGTSIHRPLHRATLSA